MFAPSKRKSSNYTRGVNRCVPPLILQPKAGLILSQVVAQFDGQVEVLRGMVGSQHSVEKEKVMA